MTQPPPPRTVGPDEGRPFLLPTVGHGRVALGAADTGGSLSIFELVLAPGEGPGEHVHSREHEVWYVLSGAFRFLLGDEIVHCPEGGLAFGPLGTPHTFQNVGPETGRLLVISAPSGLEDLFLEYDRRTTRHHDLPALAAAARVAGIDFVGPPLAVRDPIRR